MFVDLLVARRNWALGFYQSATFEEMDKKLKELIEKDLTLKAQASMSVIQRYMGYFLQPIYQSDIEEVKCRIEKEETENGK